MITINPARKQELDLLAGLYADCFNEEAGFEEWSFERAKRRLSNAFHTPQSVFLVLKSEDEPAGIAWGYADVYGDCTGFCLQEILIFTRFRNQNLGSLLLEKLFEELKEQKISFVYGQSLMDPWHIHFYEKAGFELRKDLGSWHKNL